MQEAFLHFLWNLQKFEFQDLKTTSGLPIQVIKPGKSNPNSGPDFFNATIKIGTTVWAGNIEIHVRSSDWFYHAHQKDPAYNNVILHVVYEEDKPVFLNNESIPTLELKGRIPLSLESNYQVLRNNKSWLPCSNLIKQVDPTIISIWIERCYVERLEEKTKLLKLFLKQTNNDWLRVFIICLFRGFGYPINVQPTEQLAWSILPTIINRHKDDLMHLEALFLGHAGFLEAEQSDNYLVRLQGEYRFLKNKYKLFTLKKEQWKFSRLRPSSFPTLRLAQLAKLFYQSDDLLSKVLVSSTVKELAFLFKVKVSNFWKDHYALNKKSKYSSVKTFGKESLRLLLINEILPFIFLYGEYSNKLDYKKKVIQFFSELPPENNKRIKQWKQFDVHPLNAAQSQALIHLRNEYCTKKRCLECSIGHSIIGKAKFEQVKNIFR